MGRCDDNCKLRMLNYNYCGSRSHPWKHESFDESDSTPLFSGVRLEALEPKQYQLLPLAFSLFPSP